MPLLFVYFALVPVIAVAQYEQSPPSRTDSSDKNEGPRPPAKKADEPSAEEQLWSKLKGIPVGPFTLDLGAALRLRGELLDNFNVKNFGDGSGDQILLERARLELGLHLMEGFRLFLQGQDAHELGCDFSDEDFQNGSPYNNLFDLRQAFLEWTQIGGTPVGFKLGRQSIAFTDNRLMGPGEWGNVGRYTWDAAALTWRSEIMDFDLFYAFRVQYDPTGFDYRHFDYDLLGLFSTLPVEMVRLHAFYFLQMNNFPSDEDESPLGSFHRHSPGLSLEAAFDPGLDLSLGLIPQFGEWGDNSVLALGGYAALGYTAPVYGKPRIGLHYAYGSGDSNPNDTTTRTFDGIFGAVDKYYGRMNLFAWMNLHDLQVAFSGAPVRFIDITTDYHLFLLVDQRDAWYYANGKPQRQDPNGARGRIIGHEVDIVAIVKATRHAQFQAGYGLFIPGEFIRNTGSDDLAHWGFVQGSYDL
ncbi:MAG: alginate export family protein [Deltaproteobacteria bacterium]|nr:alginate export family protein [Deltaproteobacteria bacterium]